MQNDRQVHIYWDTDRRVNREAAVAYPVENDRRKTEPLEPDWQSYPYISTSLVNQDIGNSWLSDPDKIIKTAFAILAIAFLWWSPQVIYTIQNKNVAQDFKNCQVMLMLEINKQAPAQANTSKLYDACMADNGYEFQPVPHSEARCKAKRGEDCYERMHPLIRQWLDLEAQTSAWLATHI